MLQHIRKAWPAAVCCLALSACRPGSIPLPRVAHADSAGSHAEPSLPPILTVKQSTSDPELFVIEVAPEIEGTASLSVRSDRPAHWESALVGPIFLKRGDAPRQGRLRVAPTAAGTPALQSIGPGIVKNGSSGVLVDLIVTDARGIVTMTVSREVPVPTPAQKAAPAGRSFAVTNAEGEPIDVFVPANAPAPIVAGANR